MSQDNDPGFMLGVISGKIDLILLNHEADKKATAARFDRAEQRLDVVENDISGLKRDRTWVIGLSGLASAAGGAIAAFFKLGGHG